MSMGLHGRRTVAVPIVFIHHVTGEDTQGDIPLDSFLKAGLIPEHLKFFQSADPVPR
jgi:hypothetical protein